MPIYILISFILMISSLHAQPIPKIDVHIHTAPKYFESTDEVLKSNGIIRWINLSGGSQIQALSDQIQQAQFFDDRIAICANIPWKWLSSPDFELKIIDYLSQVHRIGVKCIKIPKSLGLYIPNPTASNQLLKINDPRLDVIWQQAGHLDLPIFIHIGDPWAFFEPLSPMNERYEELKVHPDWSFHDAKYPRPQQLLQDFESVLYRFPQTTFIGVHFANCAEDLAYVRYALDQYPNLYADIAARLPEFGRHPAHQVRALFEDFPDRFLFGTDLGIGSQIMLGSVGNDRPQWIDIFEFYEDHWRFFESNDRQIKHPTPIQGQWKIDAIGLKPQTLNKLYYLNALKLIWKRKSETEIQVDLLNDLRELKNHLSLFELFGIIVSFL